MGKRAVVIGSGFGGLAAAARLRALGFDVTVLEARDQPGGRAGVFEREGYTFDAGPTVITAPYLLEELFEILGRDMSNYIELMPVDPFYRVTFPEGESFDYSGDEERLFAEIERFNPRDVAGYQRMVVRAKEIFHIGYEQLVAHPFLKVTDMFGCLPDLLRLGSFRSVYSLVSKYIEDERLRQVFTFQPMLIGGNPFKTTSIYMLIHWLERKWGVHFAKGGTGAIINGLVQLLQDSGVEVRLGAPVSEIVVDSQGRASGVRLEGGGELRADFVVANADPSFVYTEMLAPEHRRVHTDRRVARKRQSMSLFVVYFGTDRTYPDLAHHTIVMGPRYRGLLTDIFDRKVLADDFSLYLHSPTRSDPSLAPPGHDGFYALSPVPNNQSGIDWVKEGDAYADRILVALEERHMPGLRASITTRSFITPDFFEHELRSVAGAGFGIEPILLQSAYFRYHNRSEDVGNLYFVGSGVHPGAGVPGVIQSARVLETLVKEDFPTRPFPVASAPV